MAKIGKAGLRSIKNGNKVKNQSYVPGDRIRINGVVLLDSAKLVAMSKRGILMNSSPMCLVTYSLIEKITLSGRSIRYKTILSNSLENKRKNGHVSIFFL